MSQVINQLNSKGIYPENISNFSESVKEYEEGLVDLRQTVHRRTAGKDLVPEFKERMLDNSITLNTFSATENGYLTSLSDQFQNELLIIDNLDLTIKKELTGYTNLKV